MIRPQPRSSIAGQDGPASVEDAGQVDVDGSLPGLERHLPGRDAVLGHARVVDHDVDPARPGEDRPDHRLDGRVIGDVDGDGQRRLRPTDRVAPRARRAGSIAMSATTTRTPSRTKRSHIALPSAPAAPVTMATRRSSGVPSVIVMSPPLTASSVQGRLRTIPSVVRGATRGEEPADLAGRGERRGDRKRNGCRGVDCKSHWMLGSELQCYAISRWATRHRPPGPAGTA